MERKIRDALISLSIINRVLKNKAIKWILFLLAVYVFVKIFL